MQMVLNELSSGFPCTSVDSGKQVMEAFINTYFKVKDIITNECILLDQTYYSMELAPGYRLEQWRNDVTVDIELKRKFRRLLNMSEVYNSKEFDENFICTLTSEFSCKGMESKGCLLAHELSGVAVSFLSSDLWKCTEIDGIYTSLCDDGELFEESVTIPNVSCTENIMKFQSSYQQHLEQWGRKKIKSGQDILGCQMEQFPNLIFCERAIYQLRNEIGTVEAIQVYKKLLELQEVALNLNGIFQKEMLKKATPESTATLARFKAEHTIKLPDGRTQLFSWHIRFTGSYAGRIFFEPALAENRIFIGNIGRKLPTVKYH